MYKFTNGIVVFDKETRDNYLRAGFTLAEEPKKEDIIEGQINIDEVLKEETNENKKDNPIIGKKSKPSNRISK